MRVTTGNHAQLVDIDSLPSSNSKLYPQRSGDPAEIVDRWYVPGDFDLVGLRARCVNGVTNSPGGTYVLRVYKEAANGGEEVLFTRDLNTGGRPLPDQFDVELLTEVLSYSQGDNLMVGIENDTDDLTDGEGILITPLWAKRF